MTTGHLTKHTRIGSPRGLTLVETVISMVLVGVLLVAALNMVGASKHSQQKGTQGHQGHLLAQSLMAEILRQNYADPVDGPDSFGLSAAESATGDRSLFDDVDDYDQWQAAPPQYKDGTVMGQLPDWKQEVKVDWVDPADLSQAVGSHQGVKRIAVNVSYKEAIISQLQAIKSIGLPPPIDENTIRVLFVVGDPAALTSLEQARKTRLTSWEYTVTLIAAADSQANYDTALADVDVAYVTGQISSNDLGTKLTAATVGVLNSDIGLCDDLGIAEMMGANKRNSSGINIIDNAHYVTSGFSLGDLTLYSYLPGIWTLSGALAPGLQILGQTESSGSSFPPGLAVLETGAELYGGGSAAGRRVQLPWSEGGFDFNALNADGLNIMKRAFEWAAGASDPLDPNFGYQTQFASTQSPGNGVQVGTQVTLPQDGTLNSITAYIYPGGGGKDYRYAIYTDNAGEPGNLIVETAVDNQSGTGWKTIAVTPTPLTAGTYWLALSFSANTQDYYYESTGGNTRHKLHPAVTNGFISVWPGSTTPYPYKVSIYATTTPPPPP